VESLDDETNVLGGKLMDEFEDCFVGVLSSVV